MSILVKLLKTNCQVVFKWEELELLGAAASYLGASMALKYITAQCSGKPEHANREPAIPEQVYRYVVCHWLYYWFQSMRGSLKWWVFPTSGDWKSLQVQIPFCSWRMMPWMLRSEDVPQACSHWSRLGCRLHSAPCLEHKVQWWRGDSTSEESSKSSLCWVYGGSLWDHRSHQSSFLDEFHDYGTCA